MIDKILGFFHIILHLIFVAICGIITIVVSLCVFLVVIPLAFLLRLAAALIDAVLIDDEDCFKC